MITTTPIATAQAYAGAILSDDRKYRYSLWRRWNLEFPQLTWIMLNPSTADENKDDATIRRVINFTRAWGFGGFDVINLFALRATDPVELLVVPDPVGPENDYYFTRIPPEQKIIAAWGAWGKGNYLNRASTVAELLRDRPIFCLGRTVTGQPKHPVRLAAATKLEEWR